MFATIDLLIASTACSAWRVAVAALAAWGVAALLGLMAIPCLRRFCREPNASDSPTLEALHKTKDKTPSMGGLFVLPSVLLVAAFMSEIFGPSLLAGTVLVVGFLAIGALDDLRKIRSGRKGLSPRMKLAAQCVVAGAVASILWTTAPSQTMLAIQTPLLGWRLPLGAAFIPFAALVIVASSNAVNLTDGLDGLASGCLLGCFAFLAAILSAFASPWDADAAVLAAAGCGAVAAFLLFNRSPARVFLGDAGSLPLGALLGYTAILARQELLLLLLGGVFVVETLSVVVQVASYRLRRRRVFLCAPLHHHFQFLGWSERRVVRWFWAASLACLVAAVAIFSVDSQNNPSKRYNASGPGARETRPRQEQHDLVVNRVRFREE